MATRMVFTREFKLEAAQLVNERGVSVPQAARDLCSASRPNAERSEH
jgi:transposase-like protein